MAVYTKISHSELEELLSGYEIGALKGFIAIEAGIQNSNYFIDTTISRYVLTIYEKRIDSDDLPFFLNLMGYLADNGVPSPALIVGKSGEALSQIQGKPCAITSFLKGGEIKNIEERHIEELGKSVAMMHLAGMRFPGYRANALSLNGWMGLYESMRHNADNFMPGIAAEITDNLNFLKQNWPSNLPSGIIHADLFPDNVFFENDHLAGFIDFYFACNDFLMYELAICINAWCFEKNNEFNAAKASILLNSYNSIRKITEEEYKALPVLLRGASMRFLLTRLYSWLNRVEGALVKTKDPMEYLQKLRFFGDGLI